MHFPVRLTFCCVNNGTTFWSTVEVRSPTSTEQNGNLTSKIFSFRLIICRMICSFLAACWQLKLNLLRQEPIENRPYIQNGSADVWPAKKPKIDVTMMTTAMEMFIAVSLFSAPVYWARRGMWFGIFFGWFDVYRKLYQAKPCLMCWRSLDDLVARINCLHKFWLIFVDEDHQLILAAVLINNSISCALNFLEQRACKDSSFYHLSSTICHLSSSTSCFVFSPGFFSVRPLNSAKNSWIFCYLYKNDILRNRKYE